MKVQLNARNRAHRFESSPEDKLLYVGLSNAIDLPYECGSGTCGTCKARLLSGEIEDLWPEAPGRKLLKDGEYLLCQCEARSDLTLEIASFVHTMEAGASVPQRYSGKIVEARKLTHDVLFLVVQLDRLMGFDAGQFVMAKAAPIAGYRGWSMVNYDRKSDRLEFVVKNKTGGGISDWLFKRVLEGETLDLFGPLGKATFFPALARNVVCIAGGTGVAGIMSILSRAAHDAYFSQYRGDVFFGVRTFDDAFFLDEFVDLEKRCGEKLSITVAFSDEPVPDSAVKRYPSLHFEQGLVHEVAGRKMAGKFQNVRAYLAGPTPAVDASIRMLLQSKVSTDNIRYDKFS